MRQRVLIKFTFLLTICFYCSSCRGSRAFAEPVLLVPANCREGVVRAAQDDKAGALLAWKAHARDLSLKMAGAKSIECLPWFLKTDDRDVMLDWLRVVVETGDPEVDAIAGGIIAFLGLTDPEFGDEVLQEGLAILERAAAKGHDGAELFILAYELDKAGFRYPK